MGHGARNVRVNGYVCMTLFWKSQCFPNLILESMRLPLVRCILKDVSTISAVTSRLSANHIAAKLPRLRHMTQPVHRDDIIIPCNGKLTMQTSSPTNKPFISAATPGIEYVVAETAIENDVRATSCPNPAK